MLRLRTTIALLVVALPATATRAQSIDEGSGLRLEMPDAGPTAEMPSPPSAETIQTPVTVRQPIATYDTQTGTWLPSCNDNRVEWLPELEVPAGMIDCSCDGRQPGSACRLWRSYVKPTDPSIDQKCVQCVKEPCLDYITVEEEYRVVVHRCFESSEPFKHEGCEGGHWYEAKGTTKVRKLHPCEAKVPVKYQKPVVRYRDVWYYIQCDE